MTPGRKHRSLGTFVRLGVRGRQSGLSVTARLDLWIAKNCDRVCTLMIRGFFFVFFLIGSYMLCFFMHSFVSHRANVLFVQLG